LANIPGVGLTKVPSGQLPVWLYFPVVVESEAFGLNRNLLARALEMENIHVRRYFEIPCHHLSCYSSQRSSKLPESEKVAYNVIALPVYNDMTSEECRLISQAIREIQADAEAVRKILDLEAPLNSAG
jgi:dTDP-4-amino-4,6-dideoxygalactose transaminase